MRYFKVLIGLTLSIILSVSVIAAPIPIEEAKKEAMNIGREEIIKETPGILDIWAILDSNASEFQVFKNSAVGIRKSIGYLYKMCTSEVVDYRKQATVDLMSNIDKETAKEIVKEIKGIYSEDTYHIKYMDWRTSLDEETIKIELVVVMISTKDNITMNLQFINNSLVDIKIL